MIFLKGLGKKQRENKEQGKTQHETPRSKNHKATQNKKNICVAFSKPYLVSIELKFC